MSRWIAGDELLKPPVEGQADAVDRAEGYFISFRCYGTWRHGDSRGSTDRRHNGYGTPLLSPDALLEFTMLEKMRGAPVLLNRRQRAVVETTVRDVCVYRGWILHAVNARSNHVHVVVSAGHSPERVMNDLKSWSTRRLVELTGFPRGVKPWSRHGSTRYLWTAEQLEAACQYVVELQDQPEDEDVEPQAS